MERGLWGLRVERVVRGCSETERCGYAEGSLVSTVHGCATRVVVLTGVTFDV